MIIGIDASRAESAKGTGTENYSLNLLRHLAKIDEKNSYILYSRKKLENKLAPAHLGANFRNCVISCPILWTQAGLSLKMLSSNIDVLFVPAHTVPLLYKPNTVVTIHGLEYEYYPENYTYFSRNYLRQSTIFSAKRSRKIIVPSENTKQDLVKFYRINPDKITVIHHGIDENTKTKTAHSAIVRNNDAEERYILFIGRIEVRKNIVRLVEAFDIFKKKNPAERNLKLVLAGKKGVGFDKVKKAIDGSPFRGDIVLKGYISEAEKEILLKNALVFAYPSLYEGFGLPILEAQTVSVPVVTSNTSSIPEIAGKGALLVDPKDVGALASEIEKLITDKEARKEITSKGLENVKRFSWEKCARETLNLLIS